MTELQQNNAVRKALRKRPWSTIVELAAATGLDRVTVKHALERLHGYWEARVNPHPTAGHQQFRLL